LPTEEIAVIDESAERRVLLDDGDGRLI